MACGRGPSTSASIAAPSAGVHLSVSSPDATGRHGSPLSTPANPPQVSPLRTDEFCSQSTLVSPTESPGTRLSVSCGALHCSGFVMLFTLTVQEKQAQIETGFIFQDSARKSTVVQDNSWHTGWHQAGGQGECLTAAGRGGAGGREGAERQGRRDGRWRAGREASCLALMEHTVARLKFASWRCLRRGLTVSPNKVTSQGLGRG